MELSVLLESFLKLGGAAAFVTTLIAVLKRFGVVQDGQSGTVSTFLNLGLFVLFVVARVVNFDVAPVDTILGTISTIVLMLLGLMGQTIASGAFYNGAKKADVFLIGYSFSE